MKTHPALLPCRFLHIALLGLAFTVSSLPAADQTATWNSTTGNWSDFTRWNTNPLFPDNGNGGFTFDAIQSGGILTVDQAITIEKLTMSGGTNTGSGFTLTTNDLFSFSSGALNGSGTINAAALTWTGGTIGGNRSVNVTGALTLSGISSKQLGVTSGQSATLTNNGTANLSSGNLQISTTGAGTQGSFVNNGTFNATDNADVIFGSFGAGGTPSFNNTATGIFNKSGAGTTTSIAPEVLFTNNGTVNVNSGTLEFQGGTLGGGGLYDVDAGATLRFTGPTTSLSAASTVSGAGTVNVNGTVILAGSYNVTGITEVSGVARFNGASAATTTTLNWTQGAISGSSGLAVSGTMTLSSISTKQLGVTSGQSTTLTNNGTANLSGGNLQISTTGAGTQGVFVNNGTFNATDNADVIFGSFGAGGTPTFNNTATGIFNKSGAGTTTTIGSSLAFTNSGTVNVNSGTLELSGTVTQHSGSTLTGGTWNVTNGSTLNITTGSNIQTNQGSVMLDGAGSSFNRLTTALNNNQGSLTLKNDRDLTTAGAYTNSGTTRVEDSTTVMAIGTGGSAAYTQTAGVTALVNGAFIDPSVFSLNGGTLQGTGTIESNVISGLGSHTIAPGLSPGTLTINGNLTLSSGSTLTMELGGLTQGTLYDHLDVNGTLTLAGMLDLDFINDFQNTLSNGEILTLATANTDITGSFLNVASGSHLTTNFPFALQVWYGAGSPFGAENLVVVVPEPSRTMLLMLSGLLMLRRRRRGA